MRYCNWQVHKMTIKHSAKRKLGESFSSTVQICDYTYVIANFKKNDTTTVKY